MLRDPDDFMRRLFPSHELSAWTPQDPPAQPKFVHHLIELINSALAHFSTDAVKEESADRIAAFQELILLPAETQRVRALNSAWMATSAILEETRGEKLDVFAGPQSIELQIEDLQKRPKLASSHDVAHEKSPLTTSQGSAIPPEPPRVPGRMT